MTKVLAGLTPSDGTVTRSGTIGYLPQDPKVDDRASWRVTASFGVAWTVWRARCVRRRTIWRVKTPVCYAMLCATTVLRLSSLPVAATRAESEAGGHHLPTWTR